MCALGNTVFICVFLLPFLQRVVTELEQKFDLYPVASDAFLNRNDQ